MYVKRDSSFILQVHAKFANMIVRSDFYIATIRALNNGSGIHLT